MRVEIRIDESCTEPKVVVYTDRMTDEVTELVGRLSEGAAGAIVGFRGERAELIDRADVVRVYAAEGKVFAVTDGGEYRLRLRIYEAETRLAGYGFVRISKSEIVNIKKVKGFDLSFSGTICVLLSNGDTTYVSRRYMSKVKQILGL